MPFPLPLGDPRNLSVLGDLPCAGGVYGGQGVRCSMLSYLAMHTSRNSTILCNGPVCVRQSKPPPHHHHRRRRCKNEGFYSGGLTAEKPCCGFHVDGEEAEKSSSIKNRVEKQSSATTIHRYISMLVNQSAGLLLHQYTELN